MEGRRGSQQLLRLAIATDSAYSPWSESRLGRDLQWQGKFFGRYKKEKNERGGRKKREKKERESVSTDDGNDCQPGMPFWLAPGFICRSVVYNSPLPSLLPSPYFPLFHPPPPPPSPPGSEDCIVRSCLCQTRSFWDGQRCQQTLFIFLLPAYYFLYGS